MYNIFYLQKTLFYYHTFMYYNLEINTHNQQCLQCIDIIYYIIKWLVHLILYALHMDDHVILHG